MSISGKIKALSDVENDLTSLLAKVKDEKYKLEKKNIAAEVVL